MQRKFATKITLTMPTTDVLTKTYGYPSSTHLHSKVYAYIALHMPISYDETMQLQCFSDFSLILIIIAELVTVTSC